MSEPTAPACVRPGCGRALSAPFLRWQIQHPTDKVVRGPYCRDCYVQITTSGRCHQPESAGGTCNVPTE